jgi:hypothetical protein
MLFHMNPRVIVNFTFGKGCPRVALFVHGAKVAILFCSGMKFL